MIELFVRICRQRSMTGLPVAERWPDIAGQVKPHDIAVSHHVQRPETPTVDELVAVFHQLELAPQVESTRRPAPPTPQPRNLLVSFTRRRLCLDPTADPEIDRLLPTSFTVLPPEAVCIWWDSDPTAASQPPRPESRDTT